MTRITWRTNPVPPDMQVRQVYGFLFHPDGRLLIRVDGSKHSLPGGRPEAGETVYADILSRESLEEVTAEIADPHYLGYQEVDEQNGTAPYAQVRMAARIHTLHPRRPDPDNGRTYRRLFVHPQTAAALLGWGDVGDLQVTAAARAAITQLGLPADNLPDPTYL
jgi:8-oxo-dGTP diphosphatase